MALGMTAGFVACGENKGGESVKGSQESSVESAKQEQIKTETENPTTAKYFLMRILSLCSFMGSDYNANTGVYTFSYLGGVFVEASLADGKVSNYYYEEAQDKWGRGELTYGNTTVGELPVLN